MLHEISENQESFSRQSQEQNQKVDPVTGFPDENSQKNEDIDTISRIISQGDALYLLKSMPGWKLIEEFLIGQSKYLTDQLKIEQNIEKIRRLQAEILAFESLPNLIEKAFVDMEDAKRRIGEFIVTEQDNFQDPTG